MCLSKLMWGFWHLRVSAVWEDMSHLLLPVTLQVSVYPLKLTIGVINRLASRSLCVSVQVSLRSPPPPTHTQCEGARDLFPVNTSLRVLVYLRVSV